MARRAAHEAGLVGTVLGHGRYEIVGHVASGGMASVFRAHDRQLDRIVALKVPRPELARDREFSTQFRREARAAARLTHPNVVSVHDSGEDRGLPWIVMEYVPGQTLRDLLDARGRLDVATTTELVAEVADALDHAHHAGLVHLDVKPENVLLAPDTVKVADFGLVRAMRRRPDHAPAGTVRYCAPEVLRGGLVDGRADVYSLGILAYESLTGRTPFQGSDQRQVAEQHLRGRVPPPSNLVPGLPAEVDTAVWRATDPDPARRFGQASGLSVAMGAPPRSHVDEALRATATVPGTTTHTGLLPPGGGVPGEVTLLPPAMPRRADRAVLRRPRGRALRKLGSLLLLGVAVLVGANAAQRALSPGLTMPDVVGDERRAARDQLQAAGLDVKESSRDHMEVAEGRVIETDPPAGAGIEAGDKVTMVVSSGKPKVEVPRVAGREFDGARKALERRGFKVRRGEANHDRVPEGRVVGTDPGAGNEVEHGSTVTVVVSKGPAKVTVPDVTGGSRDAAERALAKAGLRMNAVGFGDHVIAQIPRGGREVRKGSTVRVIVSPL